MYTPLALLICIVIAQVNGSKNGRIERRFVNNNSFNKNIVQKQPCPQESVGVVFPDELDCVQTAGQPRSRAFNHPVFKTLRGPFRSQSVVQNVRRPIGQPLQKSLSGPGVQKARLVTKSVQKQPCPQKSVGVVFPDELDCVQTAGQPRSRAFNHPVFNTLRRSNVQPLQNTVSRPGFQNVRRPNFQPLQNTVSRPGFQNVRRPNVQPLQNTVSRPGFQNVRRPNFQPLQNTVIPSLLQCGMTSAKFDSGNQFKAQTIKAGSFPWLAAVGMMKKKLTMTQNGHTTQNDHFSAYCGGTLITNRHVLSAAHCFLSPRLKSKPTHVRLGEHHLLLNRDGAQDFRIIETRTNNYDPDTNSRDIAILKLDRTVEFKGRISPACLPFNLPEQEYSNKRLTVVGWGMTTMSKQHSYVPMREEPVHVPLLECQRTYSFLSHVITNQHMCAGRGEADACMGDSGGPLNFKSSRGRNAGHVFVVGIVSHGPTMCGSATLPGVYTSVAKYENWIRTNLN
ncbi:unnamed protein product [Meganyctiphanes norvegica]|uniref:Peptidase S1 domain-containing protein n=1 Tax=Meganyctiphanes norvegica TaxID=48144 RepID=A0AAV2SAF5_MEGNR